VVRAQNGMMDYPLNMMLAHGVGYAVANDATEHEALCARGYLPPIAGPQEVIPPSTLPPPADPAPDSVESIRAALDAKGIAYDKRWGKARLLELL
jgi:hypothetical protein